MSQTHVRHSLRNRANDKAKVFRPQVGELVIPAEPVKEKIIRGAVLNLPQPGEVVHATLQGWDVIGEVSWSNAEYGTITIVQDVWIDQHYRGEMEIRIDIKIGWKIEVLDMEQKPDPAAEWRARQSRGYVDFDGGMV